MGRARFQGEALQWLQAKSPHFVALGCIPRKDWLTKTADEFLEKFTDYPLNGENKTVGDYRKEVSSVGCAD